MKIQKSWLGGSLLLCTGIISNDTWAKAASSSSTSRASASSRRWNTACFASCAPPRFDLFSESLVCSWTTTTTRPTGHVGKEVVEVEEVMRSCGGAVQGIREPMVGSSEERKGDGDGGGGGLYLNRANDGFVFFDRGQYSFGPVVQQQEQQQQGRSSDLYVTNFMFGKTARLTLSCTGMHSSSSKEDDQIDNVESQFLRKTVRGGLDRDVPSTIGWESNPVENLSSIRFQSIVQCSMPSPGQPWTLQRAKWSKETMRDASKDGTHKKDDDESLLSSDSSSLRCWIRTQPAVEFTDWAGVPHLLGLELGQDLRKQGDGRTVLHMGVLCETSGLVQSVVRVYGPDRSLSSVSLLQGTIHM